MPTRRYSTKFVRRLKTSNPPSLAELAKNVKGMEKKGESSKTDGECSDAIASQGLSISDLMCVTKRNMANAVSNLTKHLDTVTEALAGEVNAIKWDPTGSLLASCSDDSTAKVLSATACGQKVFRLLQSA